MTDCLACASAFLGAPEVLCVFAWMLVCPIVCCADTCDAWYRTSQEVPPARASRAVWRWRGVLHAAASAAIEAEAIEEADEGDEGDQGDAGDAGDAGERGARTKGAEWGEREPERSRRKNRTLKSVVTRVMARESV